MAIATRTGAGPAVPVTIAGTCCESGEALSEDGARPMTEDEATVKRLGHDGARVMLIPENPALEPFEMLDGRILGKVVAVLRKI